MSWKMQLTQGISRFRFHYHQVRPQVSATAAANSSFAVPDVFPLQSKRTGKSVLMTDWGRWLGSAGGGDCDFQVTELVREVIQMWSRRKPDGY